MPPLWIEYLVLQSLLLVVGHVSQVAMVSCSELLLVLTAAAAAAEFGSLQLQLQLLLLSLVCHSAKRSPTI